MLLFASVGGVALAALLGRGVARTALRPVSELTGTVPIGPNSFDRRMIMSKGSAPVVRAARHS